MGTATQVQHNTKENSSVFTVLSVTLAECAWSLTHRVANYCIVYQPPLVVLLD